MILKSLSSSSKGNFHILENEDTRILLDCGLKFNKVINELNSLKIDGVLLTHEHGDHVGGCKTLIQNKQTLFYSMKETLDSINIPEFTKRAIEPYKTLNIGTFSIVPFEVKHDAIHPVNYLIKDNNTNSQLLYITDTGYIDNLIFKDIDYLLIECNFDEDWYSEENISKLDEKEAYIKRFRGNRLLGGNGHLSIQKTAKVLKKIINHNTKKIILCHISSSFEEYKTFEDRLKKKLQFENIIALNPMHIGSIINELKEKKDVISFE